MQKENKQEFKKEQLVRKSDDFSKWYTDVVLKSEMADYAPVKGCQVIRPYGYAIWEKTQEILDGIIKKAGVKNACFPLLIPEKLLQKEKEHIEGFSPELAVVTIGGGEELEERLVIRPTSETIIYEMYSKWIKSWRDLPVLINQWANVVRWEKRTRLFLRTTEFLWQEGHTVHETDQEVKTEVDRALAGYIKVYQEYFGVDGIWGRKSETEKFPGAVSTFTYEMLMPDGKALQGCTSHDLGQNFAKAFNISFLGKDGASHFPFQTCWGFSTRSIGALVMVHGDDNGLILPPEIAPFQVVVVPVFQGKDVDKELVEKVQEIKEKLSEFRVEIDDRTEYTCGWKFNEWELKGVPLRIEVGPKELEDKEVTLVRRDNGEKSKVKFDNLSGEVRKILDTIQKDLFRKSKEYLAKNTREVSKYDEFKRIMENEKGFVQAFWCENAECEAKIKDETKATTRCLPHDAEKGNGKCIYCGKSASYRWLFAQAY